MVYKVLKTQRSIAHINRELCKSCVSYAYYSLVGNVFLNVYLRLNRRVMPLKIIILILLCCGCASNSLNNFQEEYGRTDEEMQATFTKNKKRFFDIYSKFLISHPPEDNTPLVFVARLTILESGRAVDCFAVKNDFDNSDFESAMCKIIEQLDFGKAKPKITINYPFKFIPY